MKPLTIFGIPITPIGYYLNDVLSLAQVELITLDVSVTDYHTSDGKGKKETAYDKLNNMDEADDRQVTKAADEWKEKYGEGQKVTLDLSGYQLAPKEERYTLDDLKKFDVNVNDKDK